MQFIVLPTVKID